MVRRNQVSSGRRIGDCTEGMLLEVYGAAGSERKTANFWHSILCKPDFLTASESDTIRVATGGRGRGFAESGGLCLEEKDLFSSAPAQRRLMMVIDRSGRKVRTGCGVMVNASSKNAIA